MELSINQLADMTGKDRRTITTRLAKLPHTLGPKQAHLYPSAAALALIYGADAEGKSLEEARTELALEQAGLARVRREEAERQRPPLELVLQLFDEVGQATAAILKVHKNKPLPEKTINEIFEKFRDLPGRLKW
jgi:hypothetical protein